MDDEQAYFSVAGYTAATLPEEGKIFFQIDFLTNSMQPPEEANHSPRFVLQPDQALQLAEALQKVVQKLRTAASQQTPGTRH